MTHNDAVLAHLKRGRVLSAIDALRIIGTARLAARVWDLRIKGWDIQTRRVRVRTRAGHASIAVYYLPANCRA